MSACISYYQTEELCDNEVLLTILRSTLSIPSLPYSTEIHSHVSGCGAEFLYGVDCGEWFRLQSDYLCGPSER